MKINDKVYGEFVIDSKLIQNLINTKEMQRLKGVNQYGTWVLIKPKLNTSRFEHCVGVFLFLKKFKCSFEEQIAGLIHDISHPAFSHVIDYAYNQGHSQEMHHEFHEDMIKNSEIAKLLKKNNIDVDFILGEKNFKILEREIPDLCADRLDYLFRDSLVFGLADSDKVKRLLSSLVVFDDEVVFKDFKSAKDAAELYLDMSYKMWVNPLQSGSYQILADAVKIGVDKGFITEKDFHLTDNELLGKLKNSNDKEVLNKLKLINKESIVESNEEDYDFHTRGKMRYIDPKFLENGKLRRLSNVDLEFKKELERFKKWVEKGFYIKIR